MKRLLCAVCGTPLTNDEIAFGLHLHGGAAAPFLCLTCRAGDLDCPREALVQKISVLKKSGCRYFAQTYVPEAGASSAPHPDAGLPESSDPQQTAQPHV